MGALVEFSTNALRLNGKVVETITGCRSTDMNESLVKRGENYEIWWRCRRTLITKT